MLIVNFRKTNFLMIKESKKKKKSERNIKNDRMKRFHVFKVQCKVIKVWPLY